MFCLRRSRLLITCIDSGWCRHVVVGSSGTLLIPARFCFLIFCFWTPRGHLSRITLPFQMFIAFIENPVHSAWFEVANYVEFVILCTNIVAITITARVVTSSTPLHRHLVLLFYNLVITGKEEPGNRRINPTTYFTAYFFRVFCYDNPVYCAHHEFPPAIREWVQRKTLLLVNCIRHSLHYLAS